MRKLVWALVLSAGVAAPVQAAMTVGEFVAKAKALQAQGMSAMTSSDLPLIKHEADTVAVAMRNERLAAKAAGRPTAYCPPETGGGMSTAEMVTALDALPPAQRGLSVKDGLTRVLAKKYPCPR